MGKIGVIGGSGLYKIEGVKKIKMVSMKTPFGKPSDKFITGRLEGADVVFLPRHGVGHVIPPSCINYRANIYGMKKLGVERIISVAACGSLRKDFKPLDFVIPDQFVDRTNQTRQMTFFDTGIVAHIGFSDPVCSDSACIAYKSAKGAGVNAHFGATYINMEGPAFSTRAESELYRKWGMDIIGMTNMSEAKLAREAEICYVTLAAITDYDCWYKSEEPVTIEMIINNLTKNVDNSRKIIKEIVKNMRDGRKCSCTNALKDAIVTDKKFIPAKVKKDLDIIIGKYIK